jgi:hypothetical protein
VLSNGYRVTHEKDFGISDKGELDLTLCNGEEQWGPSNLAAYRKVRLLPRTLQVYTLVGLQCKHRLCQGLSTPEHPCRLQCPHHTGPSPPWPCVQAVLQQLRVVYRTHKAKRTADVLYDAPLTAASLSTALSYPQQHTVGEAARQQWAQVRQ